MREIKILFLLYFLFWGLSSAYAQQEREQGVFMELSGASTTAGIHYDSRFSANTRWGGRIGIAYTYSRSRDFFDSSSDNTRGWSFPVAVNYLIGGGRHRVEVGMGVSYGVYKCRNYSADGRTVEQERSGSFLFCDLGYRYQTGKGIMVRAGINPGVALTMRDETDRVEPKVNRAAVIYPYVSLGYSF